MLDPFTIFAIAGTFLLAGAVKGVIGLGLPTVSLGLLTAALDLTTAVTLLIVPSFVTNVWQAAVGGNGRALLLRLWPFLLMATVTVWLGATALTRVDLSLLSALLGALLVTYAMLSLAGVRLAIPARGEVWAGPLFGTANGILTGMTGSFVVPGVMFLQAIGFPRDMLVQAMGMLFTASTIALTLALQGNSLLTMGLGLVSTGGRDSGGARHDRRSAHSTPAPRGALPPDLLYRDLHAGRMDHREGRIRNGLSEAARPMH